MPAMKTWQFYWVKNRLPNTTQPVPPIYEFSRNTHRKFLEKAQKNIRDWNEILDEVGTNDEAANCAALFCWLRHHLFQLRNLLLHQVRIGSRRGISQALPKMIERF